VSGTPEVTPADSDVTNNCQSSMITDAVDLSLRSDNAGKCWHCVGNISTSS